MAVLISQGSREVIRELGPGMVLVPTSAIDLARHDRGNVGGTPSAGFSARSDGEIPKDRSRGTTGK